MTARKSLIILALTFPAASLIISGCCTERQGITQHGKTTLAKAASGREILQPVSKPVVARTNLPRPHGKIKVPAELFVELFQPEAGVEAIGILVSASSTVVARSGSVTLRIPEISGEPGRTLTLWAGVSADFIAEVREYALPALPVGKYHFVAVIAFTPDQANADKIALSQSLYLDVRADEILASNVSFRQIERLALYRKLQDRVQANRTHELSSPDRQTTTPHPRLTQAVSRDRPSREIGRLRATDPDVARQIMQLNSTKVNVDPGSETMGANQPGRPVHEKPGPMSRSRTE